MNLAEKTQLRDYLFSFISENKQQLFHQIIQNRTRHLTVVLEDIFQPHNASAVLRSADIFGLQDVHIIENENSYKVNPDVALGSAKWLNLHYHKKAEHNTLACFDALRQQGYTIVATTPHTNDTVLEELPLVRKTALIFGTELKGLSRIAMENADAFVKIPMYGFTESFNISVSAALSFYSFMTRLRDSDVEWQLSEEEQVDVHIQWAKSAIKKVNLIIADYLKAK
jgi:tRNA (guanosine-2'-O-)-methyltransferase